ncbi:MAG: succinate dehydrogenase assembly factor 2 family protein [Gammaproteobacteria bacterium]|nr:succinate dehydrogenase assembly factor 2 family protein [Gammaproteobacteria bacterium]
MWRSRRGMLELDLLFRPFAEACFEKLSGESQLVFVELLDRDDFELLDLTRQPAQIPRYTMLLQMVLQFRKTGEIADA